MTGFGWDTANRKLLFLLVACPKKEGETRVSPVFLRGPFPPFSIRAYDEVTFPIILKNLLLPNLTSLSPPTATFRFSSSTL
jgi:hypothetical protein